jgi:hypothetical protein
MQIVQETVGLLAFDYDVINVYLDVVADLIAEAGLNAPLIGGSGVFQPE